MPNMLEGSYNNLAIRYGARIANGGDGGLSRTYLTFGAPNLETESFEKAYSWAIVNNTLLNFSDKVSLQSYLIYTNSKGASASNDEAPTYFGKYIFNKKEDFTIGGRLTNYITDKFHFLSELHYSQRRDGTQPLYTTVKAGIYPSFVPTHTYDLIFHWPGITTMPLRTCILHILNSWVKPAGDIILA